MTGDGLSKNEGENSHNVGYLKEENNSSTELRAGSLWHHAVNSSR